MLSGNGGYNYVNQLQVLTELGGALHQLQCMLLPL